MSFLQKVKMIVHGWVQLDQKHEFLLYIFLEHLIRRLSQHLCLIEFLLQSRSPIEIYQIIDFSLHISEYPLE